jgi:hypothetical protein
LLLTTFNPQWCNCAFPGNPYVIDVGYTLPSTGKIGPKLTTACTSLMMMMPKRKRSKYRVHPIPNLFSNQS